MDNKIADVIDVMKKKRYTHIPIVDEKCRVVGLFGENTLFKILCDGKSNIINDSTTFRDIEEYIKIENDDTNEVYFFCSKDDKYLQCANRIMMATKKMIRKDIALITEDGTQNTKLLALTTAWDMV